MFDFTVSISAIFDYLTKANEAQDKLEEANAQMDRAAAALLQQWEGEAAKAFQEQQQQLFGFLKDLMRVGSNFGLVVKQVAEKYAEAEQTALRAVQKH